MENDRYEMLLSAHYELRAAAEHALSAKMAISLGFPGTTYEQLARSALLRAASELGYTVAPRQTEAA
jgi:phage terminase small subunit